MPVNRELIDNVKQTGEYRNGIEILGDPDDYAIQTMLRFIAFFYILTEKNEGNIEGMDSFIRQMGIVPQKIEDGLQLESADEESLTVAFTYIVGRTSKDFFEQALKHLHEHASDNQ